MSGRCGKRARYERASRGQNSRSNAYCVVHTATLTGLEPATSAVTGRHANQLRYRAMIIQLSTVSDPSGIRTRATAVKGRRPRPLNDGAKSPNWSGYRRSSIDAGPGSGKPLRGCREIGDPKGA